MPIIMELSIDVSTKEGLMLRAIRCWIKGRRGRNAVFASAGAESPDGRVQRVRPKIFRSARLPISSATANSRLRNVSSPTNLQLTVHLKKNCRSSWNDLPIYPLALTGRNGKANVNCSCAMRNAAFIALLNGRTCRSMIPTAGAASKRLIFIPTPNEYATLPTVKILRW